TVRWTTPIRASPGRWRTWSARTCVSIGSTGSCGRCARAASRRAALRPMPGPRSTSPPPRPSTARSRARSAIPWTTSWRRSMRPRGAYVSGAGPYTSGPLSFMDIYDKMCFTVSSAGGRRGAQMGTFDIGHPDVMDFVRAKREAGRLRQFNLSLLITDEFMDAVKENRQWRLAFPVTRQEVEQDGLDLADPEKVVWREWPTVNGYVHNDANLVACKVYKRLP